MWLYNKHTPSHMPLHLLHIHTLHIHIAFDRTQWLFHLCVPSHVPAGSTRQLGLLSPLIIISVPFHLVLLPHWYGRFLHLHLPYQLSLKHISMFLHTITYLLEACHWALHCPSSLCHLRHDSFTSSWPPFHSHWCNGCSRASLSTCWVIILHSSAKYHLCMELVHCHWLQLIEWGSVKSPH